MWGNQNTCTDHYFIEKNENTFELDEWIILNEMELKWIQENHTMTDEMNPRKP